MARIKLKCCNCAFEKDGEEKDLFKEGWDFFPYFPIGNIQICPNCSTAKYMMENNLFETNLPALVGGYFIDNNK